MPAPARRGHEFRRAAREVRVGGRDLARLAAGDGKPLFACHGDGSRDTGRQFLSARAAFAVGAVREAAR